MGPKTTDKENKMKQKKIKPNPKSLIVRSSFHYFYTQFYK